MAGMRAPHVVVVGAGVGGLVAAVELAARGLAVTLLERAAAPGGKLREVLAAGAPIDAGPTVFTMRWVFEEIFAAAGSALDQHLRLRPAKILARHAWSDTERLDLFADVARSEAAIGEFAGAAAARGFRDFCARAKTIWRTLETSFIRSRHPTPLSLARDAGLRGLGDLWRIAPFATLWSALGEHFTDPRLRQLFGRYATYAGSSPFLAPATLMLIAHVEQDGVWLVEGGMHRIARALADLAVARGGRMRCAAEAAEIAVSAGKVTGVRLADGERIAADAVVFNGEPAALATGLLGRAASGAAVAVPPSARSLSAVTWAMRARADGFPLSRHNVMFSRDYPAEFADIFRGGRLPAAPTVYVCAQDRDADQLTPLPTGAERLLCLVNAPPNGDAKSFTDVEIAACEQATFRLLAQCGLTLERAPEATVLTTPTNFERLFPGSGGALYGAAVHGPMASFRRPGARTKLPGLYLAGGSTHPGAGVPMAALSGRMAAASLVEDLASTARSRPAATRGGTSMR
jgi:1-hydroxycarotenoid 3,4-desaturase